MSNIAVLEINVLSIYQRYLSKCIPRNEYVISSRIKCLRLPLDTHKFLFYLKSSWNMTWVTPWPTSSRSSVYICLNFSFALNFMSLLLCPTCPFIVVDSGGVLILDRTPYTPIHHVEPIGYRRYLLFTYFFTFMFFVWQRFIPFRRLFFFCLSFLYFYFFPPHFHTFSR